MINEAINKLRNLIRSSGIDIVRYNSLSNALNYFNIDLVFDVGANKGQFVQEIRATGYRKGIVSFEPLKAAHDVLLKKSRSDSLWLLHDRCALGDAGGQAEINVSDNSVSSSLLPMMKSHEAAAPQSKYIGKETIDIQTLDGVFPTYERLGGTPFLKIDTQGFEKNVLDGAAGSIGKIKGVLLEVSLTPMYEGEADWEYFLNRFKDEGFALWSIGRQFTDRKIGRTLQTDIMFVRS